MIPCTPSLSLQSINLGIPPANLCHSQQLVNVSISYMVHRLFTNIVFFSVPNKPMVQVGSVTTTSISLSWTGADSVTESYLVTWTSSDRTGTSGVIPATTTAYTITGLQSDTTYTITVTAVNQFGNTSSNPLSQSTDPERKHSIHDT